LPPPASERSLAENQTDKPGRDWLDCKHDNKSIKNKINFISFDDIIEIFGKSDPIQFINTFKRKDNIIILKHFEKIFYSEFNKIGSINIPIIKAIDTTAAGDSFNGSFLAYHLKNKHLSIEKKILSSHVITKNVLKYRGAIIPKTKIKI